MQGQKSIKRQPGRVKIPFKWDVRLAVLTGAVAVTGGTHSSSTWSAGVMHSEAPAAFLFQHLANGRLCRHRDPQIIAMQLVERTGRHGCDGRMARLAVAEQRRLTKAFFRHHRCEVTRHAVLCTRHTDHAVGNEIHVVAWLPLPENDLALRDNLHVHPDGNICELFERDVLQARHPLHEGQRLQRELGTIMPLLAVQRVRDVLFQPCGYWCGQRAMFSLLRDGFRLCDEEQSLREPFLQSVDQVWKVLGDLIQGVLHRRVRASLNLSLFVAHKNWWKR
jgi:hypothetical protein